MLLMKRGNLGFMIKIGNLLSKTGIYALVWRTIARGDENGETPAQVLVNVLLNYGMYTVNRTILKSYWKNRWRLRTWTRYDLIKTSYVKY